MPVVCTRWCFSLSYGKTHPHPLLLAPGILVLNQYLTLDRRFSPHSFLFKLAVFLHGGLTATNCNTDFRVKCAHDFSGGWLIELQMCVDSVQISDLRGQSFFIPVLEGKILFSPRRFVTMHVLCVQSTRVVFASLRCCCHSPSKGSVLAGAWQEQTCSACV